MPAAKCQFKDCTAEALNTMLVLKRGGSAKCLYCAKHAEQVGFILPAPARPAPAAKTAN